MPYLPDTSLGGNIIRGGRPAPTGARPISPRATAATATAPVGQRPQPSLPVWLPWLGAPAFLLLPMAGCGLADSLRQAPALSAPASAAVATVQTHPFTSQQPLAMTVVPVVPVGPARR